MLIKRKFVFLILTILLLETLTVCIHAKSLHLNTGNNGSQKHIKSRTQRSKRNISHNEPVLHILPKPITHIQLTSQSPDNLEKPYINDVEYDLRLRQLMEELVLRSHSENQHDITSEQRQETKYTQEANNKTTNLLSYNSSSSVQNDKKTHEPQQISVTKDLLFDSVLLDFMSKTINLTKIANRNTTSSADDQKIAQELEFLQKNADKFKRFQQVQETTKNVTSETLLNNLKELENYLNNGTSVLNSAQIIQNNNSNNRNNSPNTTQKPQALTKTKYYNISEELSGPTYNYSAPISLEEYLSTINAKQDHNIDKKSSTNKYESITNEENITVINPNNEENYSDLKNSLILTKENMESIAKKNILNTENTLERSANTSSTVTIVDTSTNFENISNETLIKNVYHKYLGIKTNIGLPILDINRNTSQKHHDISMEDSNKSNYLEGDLIRILTKDERKPNNNSNFENNYHDTQMNFSSQKYFIINTTLNSDHLKTSSSAQNTIGSILETAENSTLSSQRGNEKYVNSDNSLTNTTIKKYNLTTSDHIEDVISKTSKNHVELNTSNISIPNVITTTNEPEDKINMAEHNNTSVKANENQVDLRNETDVIKFIKEIPNNLTPATYIFHTPVFSTDSTVTNYQNEDLTTEMPYSETTTSNFQKDEYFDMSISEETTKNYENYFTTEYPQFLKEFLNSTNKIISEENPQNRLVTENILTVESSYLTDEVRTETTTIPNVDGDIYEDYIDFHYNNNNINNTNTIESKYIDFRYHEILKNETKILNNKNIETTTTKILDVIKEQNYLSNTTETLDYKNSNINTEDRKNKIISSTRSKNKQTTQSNAIIKNIDYSNEIDYQNTLTGMDIGQSDEEDYKESTTTESPQETTEIPTNDLPITTTQKISFTISKKNNSIISTIQVNDAEDSPAIDTVESIHSEKQFPEDKTELLTSEFRISPTGKFTILPQGELFRSEIKTKVLATEATNSKDSNNSEEYLNPISEDSKHVSASMAASSNKQINNTAKFIFENNFRKYVLENGTSYSLEDIKGAMNLANYEISGANNQTTFMSTRNSSQIENENAEPKDFTNYEQISNNLPDSQIILNTEEFHFQNSIPNDNNKMQNILQNNDTIYFSTTDASFLLEQKVQTKNIPPSENLTFFQVNSTDNENSTVQYKEIQNKTNVFDKKSDSTENSKIEGITISLININVFNISKLSGKNEYTLNRNTNSDEPTSSYLQSKQPAHDIISPFNEDKNKSYILEDIVDYNNSNILDFKNGTGSASQDSNITKDQILPTYLREMIKNNFTKTLNIYIDDSIENSFANNISNKHKNNTIPAKIETFQTSFSSADLVEDNDEDEYIKTKSVLDIDTNLNNIVNKQSISTLQLSETLNKPNFNAPKISKNNLKDLVQDENVEIEVTDNPDALSIHNENSKSSLNTDHNTENDEISSTIVSFKDSILHNPIKNNFKSEQSQTEFSPINNVSIDLNDITEKNMFSEDSSEEKDSDTPSAINSDGDYDNNEGINSETLSVLVASNMTSITSNTKQSLNNNVNSNVFQAIATDVEFIKENTELSNSNYGKNNSTVLKNILNESPIGLATFKTGDNSVQLTEIRKTDNIINHDNENTEAVTEVVWLTQSSSYQKPSVIIENIPYETSIIGPLYKISNDFGNTAKVTIVKPEKKSDHLSELIAIIGNSLQETTQKSEQLLQNEDKYKNINDNKNIKKSRLKKIQEDVTSTVNCHTGTMSFSIPSTSSLSSTELETEIESEAVEEIEVNNRSALIEKTIGNNKQNIKKWSTFKNNKLNNDSSTKSGSLLIKENANADNNDAVADTDDSDVDVDVYAYVNAAYDVDVGNDEGTTTYSNQKNMRLEMMVENKDTIDGETDKNNDNDRLVENGNNDNGSILQNSTNNQVKTSQNEGGINEMSTIENKLLDISKSESNVMPKIAKSSHGKHEMVNNKYNKKDYTNKENEMIIKNKNHINPNSTSEIKTPNIDDEIDVAEKRPNDKTENMFDNLLETQSFPVITPYHSNSTSSISNTDKNILASAQTKEEITATNWWHSLPYAEIRKFLNSIFDSVTSTDKISSNGSDNSTVTSAAASKTTSPTNASKLKTIKGRKSKKEQWPMWVLNNILSSLL